MYCNYNANPVARRGDDCTVRAISKVLGKTWDEVYCALCQYGRSRSNGRGGMWSADGSYDGGMYDGMNDSYANRRGMHYVRGHYSRSNGLADEIRSMMDETEMSSSDKMVLEKALQIIRR